MKSDKITSLKKEKFTWGSQDLDYRTQDLNPNEGIRKIKPLFPTSKIDSVKQVQKIRIRLWKILSAHGRKVVESSSSLRYVFPYAYVPRFTRTLRSCLKTTKKVNIYLTNYKETKYFFHRSLRLQAIYISFPGIQFNISKFLKTRFVHQLRECTLIDLSIENIYQFLHYQITMPLPRLVLTRVRVLKLSSCISDYLSVRLLRRMNKLNSLELQEMDYSSVTKIMKILEQHNPQLGKLSIYFNRNDVKKSLPEDFSYLHSLKHIKSLAVSFPALTIPTIPCMQIIEKMKKLKHLYLEENSPLLERVQSGYQINQILTNLKRLETFWFKTDHELYHLDTLGKAISDAKHLKDLSLYIPQQKFTFNLFKNIKASLKALTFRGSCHEHPSDLKELSAMLLRHGNLISLNLKLRMMNFKILDVVSSTVGKMKKLEHFGMRFSDFFYNRNNDFSYLKEFISSLEKLKSLSLEMERKEMYEKELRKIIEGIKEIKHLNQLVLKVSLSIENTDILGYVARFVKNARGFKKLVIDLGNVNQEDLSILH